MQGDGDERMAGDPSLQTGADGDAGAYDSGDFIPNFVSKSSVTYGSMAATISDIQITDLIGRPRNVLVSGLRYRYRYRVDFLQDAEAVSFGMLIKTVQGFELGGANNENRKLKAFAQGQTAQAHFDFTCNLLPGAYFCNAGVFGAVAGGERSHLHRILDAIAFRVVRDPADPGFAQGIVHLQPELMIG